MDPLADKILISTALFGFAYLKLIFWWMVWFIVIRDFIMTSLRIFATNAGKAVVTSTLAKWKTFSQMTVTIVLLIYMNLANYGIVRPLEQPPLQWSWLSISMLIVTLITGISGIQYLIENRSHLNEIYRRFLRLFNR